MSKKISILDKIFKAVFFRRIRRIHITNYETKLEILRREKAELKKIIAHDQLTGALSYVEFEERVEYFLSLFRRFSHKNGNKRCFSIVFIDLYRFKNINDVYGHEAGDNALVSLVSFLKKQLRGSDLVARNGGDEFLLFLEGCNLDAGIEIMNNIQSRLKHRPLSFGENEDYIQISFGVASTSEGIGDLKEIIKTADRKMYKQKKSNSK